MKVEIGIIAPGLRANKARQIIKVDIRDRRVSTFLLFRFGELLQKFIKCHIQNICEIHQLNICNKTLAGLYALNCIFVDIKARELKHIRKLTL